MAPGAYVLSGIPVDLGEDGVPRNVDGTIAGSALTLDQAVRNMIGLGLPVPTVIEAASLVPADAIGRTDLGRIAPGARADLVHWTEDFHPARTWVDGREFPAFVGTGVGRVRGSRPTPPHGPADAPAPPRVTAGPSSSGTR